MPNYQSFVGVAHIGVGVGANAGGGGFLPNFSDNETPSGAIDSVNAVFTLAHTPNPAASLDLFKNGQLMIAGGADFTLATATITFTSAAKPQVGDVLIASYRY